ncbi:YceI family protein [Formosa sp. S-31]|uniref:YceI family protein n=1 Tax=Formosa sp. S-31 TaxID=2790949 RepID=UPI003EBC55B4
MKTPQKLKAVLPLLLVAFLISNFSISAQTLSLSNSDSKLSVFGTSSLHDWEEKAEKQKGSITIETGDTPAIKALAMEIAAESLKSGKSGMDKNTYKALKTDKHKTITFKLSDTKSVTASGNNTYKVSATGALTLAGVTKTIPLDFTMTVNGSTVKLTGEKSFKMSEFKIDPPTAMFGTVTTGDEVKITFTSVFK